MCGGGLCTGGGRRVTRCAAAVGAGVTAAMPIVCFGACARVAEGCVTLQNLHCVQSSSGALPCLTPAGCQQCQHMLHVSAGVQQAW